MNVEVLQILSIVLFILAGVFLIAAIALFFVFDVVKIVGDLSGSTARRAIDDIRRQNENVSDHANTGSVNKSRVTDRISQTGSLHRSDGGIVTEKFKTGRLREISPTTLLSDETTLLNNNETTLLNSSETTLLNEAGTMPNIPAAPILPVNAPSQQPVIPGRDWAMENAVQNLTLIYEIGFVGSTEIVE